MAQPLLLVVHEGLAAEVRVAAVHAELGGPESGAAVEQGRDVGGQQHDGVRAADPPEDGVEFGLRVALHQQFGAELVHPAVHDHVVTGRQQGIEDGRGVRGEPGGLHR
jgi:hypothetical protein